MTTEKQHFPLVRTIYLYLFALVGLALLSIGVVRMVDLGLKALVFTGADESQRTYARQPLPSLVAPERLDKAQGATDLTAEEKTLLKQWLADYKIWQETQAKLDPVREQRQRDASTSLALIIVGLPLYLFHWGIIRKETGRNAPAS
jgi:hypothetical protein